MSQRLRDLIKHVLVICFPTIAVSDFQQTVFLQISFPGVKCLNHTVMHRCAQAQGAWSGCMAEPSAAAVSRDTWYGRKNNLRDISLIHGLRDVEVAVLFLPEARSQKSGLKLVVKLWSPESPGQHFKSTDSWASCPAILFSRLETRNLYFLWSSPVRKVSLIP